MGKTLPRGHRGCVWRSQNWNPDLAPECESAWPLHLGSSVTANPLLVTFCLHVTPPPTIRSPRAGWSSFISMCPALSRGLGPKQERSKAGGWMPTGRKWPQKCPRMPITEANPTNSPHPWSESTDHLLSPLRPAPPQVHLKGRVSSHTSGEGGGGFQQVWAVHFQTCPSFCFPILSWSIWSE